MAATGSSTELCRLGVVQKNSRPNHTTTSGKVERFQQTRKNCLRAQPPQPATIAELQTLLEAIGRSVHRRDEVCRGTVEGAWGVGRWNG